MSGPLGSSQWMYSSGGFYPYEIEQSLRLNDNDSAYLYRTPASAGNRKTWTWSGWVKRGNLGAYMGLFTVGNSTNHLRIALDSSDKLFIFQRTSSSVVLSLSLQAVLRDPSAWYHFVFEVDTTQAAALDRVKMYVNGVQITYTTATAPALNLDTQINNTLEHRLSRYEGTNAFYFDGYMAEVNFIDGTALDPTSFGEFKSGVWVPKAYSGSYGTNGFYLNFSDSAAIGDDLSGNGNDFTPSGIATSDQMLDSPTNNFSTLNPLWPYGLQPLEGNLSTAATSEAMATSTFSLPQSGKWYVEARMNGNTMYGLVVNGVSPGVYPGYNTNGFALFPGRLYYNGSATTVDTGSWANLLGSIHVVGMMLDMDNSKMFYHVDGTWKQYGDPDASGAGYSFPSTIAGKDVLIITRAGTIGIYGDRAYVNFGQDATFSGLTSPGTLYSDSNSFGEFMYPVPTDALALCTQNLPEPTFDPRVGESPQDAFNVYTDTGANILSTAQSDYSDGLFWIKDRQNASTDHQMLNTVTNTVLESNTTDAERSYSNPSGSSVAWSWKAATAFSGTTNLGKSYSGKSNAAAGISIVTYTGAGSGHQIPHNLSDVPKFIVIKQRTPSGTGHITYHASQAAAPELGYLNLGTSNGYTPSSTIWADTAPTSSYVTLGASASVSSNTTYTMLAFAEKEGFSKFGSYTGNNSADGSFVYLGFRPAFVMVKSTGTGSWYIVDTARDGYNVDNDYLLANTDAAESTANTIDLLSNGFKLRSTTYNAASTTYVYAAFAEQPFKYSNAR